MQGPSATPAALEASPIGGRQVW